MTEPSLRVLGGLGGRVLDTSALIELALGRTQYARAFVRWSTAQGVTWAVPSSALAEAWSLLSDKGRSNLAVLVQLGHAVVEPLALPHAGPVGEILEAAGAGGDVCAAHVAEVAARRSWPILTNRGVLLRSMIPGLEIEPLP